MTIGPPPQTQMDWVIAKLQDIGNTLNAGLQDIANIQGAHTYQLGRIAFQMASTTESIAALKAASDQLTASDAALATEVGTLHTAVDNLIVFTRSIRGQLSPADQATLDAATAAVASAGADLATQTQTLTTTEQAATAESTPPTP